MLKTRISTSLIVIGIVLMIISLTADLIYLGGDLNSFGWKQILGTGAGLLALIIGIWLRMRKNKTNNH